jgi:hypothetical protein
MLFNFRIFKDMAIGVLEYFDKNTTEAVDDVLIVRYIEELKIYHLDLAVICKCKNFISNSLVQRVLDDIWKGTKFCDSFRCLISKKPKNEDVNILLYFYFIIILLEVSSSIKESKGY